MASKVVLQHLLQTLVLAAILFTVSEGLRFPLSWRRLDIGQDVTQQCLGMLGNRDLFDNLSRICSDCQNIFRDKNVEGKCRSDCFNSSYFEACVLALELTEKMTDYKLHASILKQG